tara:strand:+ start:69 stop:476 length:408 start_codon:yes stop_codon:yes gene_type:complete
MNIEDKAQEIIEEFKKKMLLAADDAISDCYLEILPHVENDTYMNVQSRSEAVIKNIIIGDVIPHPSGNGVVAKDDSGVSVRISIDDGMFDSLRDALVKSMPVCPKDLKIKSLELTIERMDENRSYILYTQSTKEK